MPNALKALLKFKFKLKSKTKSKIRTPVDMVRRVRELLIIFNDTNKVDHGPKWDEKIEELGKLMMDIKIILYGTSDAEPVAEACVQVTQEFFREHTFRVLITCLPKLDLEARKDATQIVANLQRQQVHSRLIACDYLESNIDIMDILVSGYEDRRLCLHYGNMLRECVRHQSIAKYLLDSHLHKFFDFIQLPDFDVSADADASLKELLTRHKSTVSEFLSKNYDWVNDLQLCLIQGLSIYAMHIQKIGESFLCQFFRDFNTKLLQSSCYITKRQSVKLLADMLLDRSNSAIMMQYVSSKDNLIVLMNLLREQSMPIQRDAFHVFKLFAANKNKPPEITCILIKNREKLLRFFGNFKLDKEDEQFEADKAQVIKVIAEMEPIDIR